MGSCKKCGKCCRSDEDNEKIVIVYPSDMKRLADGLHIRTEDFIYKYCREEFIEYSKEKIQIFVLKKEENHCVFLTSTNKCEIYEFRPVQCMKAPYHYFSNEKMWGDIDCIDISKLRRCETKEQDKKLILELLMGYDAL